MLARFRKWFIDFILVALAISGCTRSIPLSAPSLDQPEKPSSGFSLLPAGLFKRQAQESAPGDYTLTLKVRDEKLADAKTRSYLLHIPPSYDGSSPIPLVVLLHGSGLTTEQFADLTDFNELSDANGFIAVYPDAYGAERTWNTGLMGGEGANDLAFLTSLVKRLTRDYAVDPRSVYLVGDFDGGMMAFRLAGAMADTIAAVGVHGATIGYQQGAGTITRLEPSSGPVSVVMVHGQDDPRVPYETTPELSAGNPGFLTAKDAVAYWIEQDGCSPEPSVDVYNDENIRQYTYACLKGTAVQLVHVWYGDQRWNGSFVWEDDKAASMEISASNVIWAFLAAHPKPAAQ